MKVLDVINQARFWLAWYNRQMECLCDDPMTEAYGAPVGEFAEDWKREQIKHLRELLPQLPEGTTKRRVADYIAGDMLSRTP
jgi:hypothetical protein